LGMTWKQLSDRRLETSKTPYSVRPGQFLYYRDTHDDPMRLSQCVSGCNNDGEFAVLTVKRINHKLDSSELQKTNITIMHDSFPRLKSATYTIENETEPKINDVVVWKDEDILLVVTKPNIYTEFIPKLILVHIESDLFTPLVRGSAACIPKDFKGIIQPIGDGTPCTFLAMYQREVALGDTQLGIKRYFCTEEPSRTIRWKVYCGHTPLQEESLHVFRGQAKAECVDGIYFRARTSESGGLARYRSQNTLLFVNIYIILHHWA